MHFVHDIEAGFNKRRVVCVSPKCKHYENFRHFAWKLSDKVLIVVSTEVTQNAEIIPQASSTHSIY